jgi:hypothetical protein
VGALREQRRDPLADTLPAGLDFVIATGTNWGVAVEHTSGGGREVRLHPCQAIAGSASECCCITLTVEVGQSAVTTRTFNGRGVVGGTESAGDARTTRARSTPVEPGEQATTTEITWANSTYNGSANRGVRCGEGRHGAVRDQQRDGGR